MVNTSVGEAHKQLKQAIRRKKEEFLLLFIFCLFLASAPFIANWIVGN